MESSILVKTFALLETMARLPADPSLAVLCRESQLPKPTAHRILKTLVGLGYVERIGAGRYRQTGQIRRLIDGDADARLRELAEPVLRDLLAQTGETVNLGVLRNENIFYLRVLESPQALRHAARETDTDPAHCTALGRAILAHLPDARRKAILAKAAKASTIDMQKLPSIIEHAQSNGFAIDDEETDIGVTCIGVPVFESGSVTAAISISAPSTRMQSETQTKWTALLIQTAQALCDALDSSTPTCTSIHKEQS